MDVSRAVELAVARLGTVAPREGRKLDPAAEARSARHLHSEVALARHLEARARLRGRVLSPQSPPPPF